MSLDNILDQLDNLDIDELKDVMEKTENLIIYLTEFSKPKIDDKKKSIFREKFKNKFSGWEFDDYNVVKKCGSYKEDFKETIIHEIIIEEIYKNTNVYTQYILKFWEGEIYQEYKYYRDDELIMSGSFDGDRDEVLFGNRGALQKIGYVYDYFVLDILG
jgi:hypothetical protein